MSTRSLLYLLIHLVIQSIAAENFRCEKDGFFADIQECRLYHICAGTTHSVKTCKDDLLFNPIKNDCDWAINVNCTRPPPEKYRPVTASTQNAPRPIDLKTSASDGVSGESVLDDSCRSIANDFVAHPTDCKQYAYCANGVPQVKVCKGSLLWSQVERMCVWPAQSDCPVKIRTAAPPTAAPAQREMPWKSGDTTYPTSHGLTDAPPAGLCPPTKSWRIPDPYDCSIYHDCYHGADLIAYCPSPLQYNPEKQKCDHAHTVQCKNKCTANNEGARFIDPLSCCHFYECMSGRLIAQVCPHPNLYDVQTRKCLPYQKVKCSGRRPCLNKCQYASKSDAGRSSCDFSPSCVGHSNGFYPDRTKPNCQSYIHCVDYRVANHSRCLHGQRFNRNMGRCTPADQVPCLAPSSRPVWLVFTLCIVSITAIL